LNANHIVNLFGGEAIASRVVFFQRDMETNMMNTTLRYFLMAATLLSCVGTPSYSDSQAAVTDSTVRPGEIEIRGEITDDDPIGARLSMSVDYVQGPNGHVTRLDPSRNRSVICCPTILAMTNGVATICPNKVLHKSDYIYAIGPKVGEGQPLTARVIVFLDNEGAFEGWHSGSYMDQQLENCAKCSDPKGVKARIAAGVDVNARVDPNQGCDTALMLAAHGLGDLTVSHWEDRPLACVKALIKAGAKVNALDRGGETALFRACENGNTKCVKALIAAGAYVNIEAYDGDTALSIAKGRDDAAAIIVALKAAGAKK